MIFALKGFASLIRPIGQRTQFLIPFFLQMDTRQSDQPCVQNLTDDYRVQSMFWLRDTHHLQSYYGQDIFIECGGPGLLAYYRGDEGIVVARPDVIFERLRSIDDLEKEPLFALEAAFLLEDLAAHERAATAMARKLEGVIDAQAWLSREHRSARFLVGPGAGDARATRSNERAKRREAEARRRFLALGEVDRDTAPPTQEDEPVPELADRGMPDNELEAAIENLLKRLNSKARRKVKEKAIQGLADLPLPLEKLVTTVDHLLSGTFTASVRADAIAYLAVKLPAEHEADLLLRHVVSGRVDARESLGRIAVLPMSQDWFADALAEVLESPLSDSHRKLAMAELAPKAAPQKYADLLIRQLIQGSIDPARALDELAELKVNASWFAEGLNSLLDSDVSRSTRISAIETLSFKLNHDDHAELILRCLKSGLVDPASALETLIDLPVTSTWFSKALEELISARISPSTRYLAIAALQSRIPPEAQADILLRHLEMGTIAGREALDAVGRIKMPDPWFEATIRTLMSRSGLDPTDHRDILLALLQGMTAESRVISLMNHLISGDGASEAAAFAVLNQSTDDAIVGARDVLISFGISPEERPALVKILKSHDFLIQRGARRNVYNEHDLRNPVIEAFVGVQHPPPIRWDWPRFQGIREAEGYLLSIRSFKDQPGRTAHAFAVIVSGGQNRGLARRAMEAIEEHDGIFIDRSRHFFGTQDLRTNGIGGRFVAWLVNRANSRSIAFLVSGMLKQPGLAEAFVAAVIQARTNARPSGKLVTLDDLPPIISRERHAEFGQTAAVLRWIS